MRRACRLIVAILLSGSPAWPGCSSHTPCTTQLGPTTIGTAGTAGGAGGAPGGAGGGAATGQVAWLFCQTATPYSPQQDPATY